MSFTRLSATLRLFNIKAKNGWTDRSFSELHVILQRVKHYQPVNMRRKRYYVQWVWSTKKFMFVPMIVFFIKKSLKHWLSVEDEEYHDTKLRMMAMMKITWKRVLLQKCYGIFMSYLNLSVYLLMLIMLKTFSGMQREEKVMIVTTCN